MKSFSVVGERVAPVYGEQKAAGTVKFPADIILPNMLWMKILRSPHAHARILEIDVSRAEKMWGVRGILTHQDVPRVFFGPFKDEFSPLDEEVLFVGDTVAAVAAEDWNIAEEAARAIRVKYETLPAIYDPEAAAQTAAPMAALHFPDSEDCWWGRAEDPEFLRGVTNVIAGNSGKPTWLNKRGDVERGLRESDFVVERVYYHAHVNGVAHEPRACVASYENDGCTLWCSVQDPYKVRDAVVRVLGLSQENVRVISTMVGGAFGVKVLGRFAVLAALMSRKTGRPVKIWFTREEETLDSHNRPALIHHVKAGANRDGSLTAFRVKTYVDNGYSLFGGLGENIAKALCTRTMDLYHKCPHVLWEVFTVRTNHPSAGPFRGRADAESHFPTECVVDELAHAVQMDPVEFRLKNRIYEGDELCSEEGKVMSSVGVEEAVRKGAEAIGWARRNPVPGSAPGPWKWGMGMAMVIHSCGSNAFGTSEARVELDEGGTVSLFSGTPDQGSEQQTTLRQMVAEVLGLSLDRVAGTNADTSNCPFDSGPYSSRTVYCTGIAATRAAEELKKKILERASLLLEAPPGDLETGRELVWMRADPSRKVGYRDLAKDGGSPLSAWARYNPGVERRFAYGFAAVYAEVEVDVGTGAVKILRLVSAHDVGRAINPVIVDGQIKGGAAQGLGYALSEGFRFDPHNGTALNQWFLDLKTPSILDTPEIEPIIIELGEPTHPFGAKGCSEISYVGVAPAVANAIYNATGVRLLELPMTPERVLQALRAANGESA